MRTANPWSRAALLLSLLFFVYLAFFYYPKWQKVGGSEAAISWDISGYYWYLPSFLIYEDAKGQRFAEDILAQYQPTGTEFQQAFEHESGNYVMKYPLGQALQFLPFFGVAHAVASASKTYPADGFSLPYQLAITIESLLMALLGLWALRKWLLRFVSDQITALTLLLIAFGTNYTEYAALTGAMTHNNLFAIYGLILLLCVHYGQRPGYLPAAGLGLLVGLAALTRPTEILAATIPLGWGAFTLLQQPRPAWWSSLKPHLGPILLGGLCAGLMGSLQLLYWHYASGDWIVYSYQDQGFDWLSPHFKECLVGYRAGWWIYTPLMMFPFLGYVLFWKKSPQLAAASAVFLLLFMYVAFAWSIWWYGGSLGQRTMISTYPILAVPLALLLEWAARQVVALRVLLYAALLVCVAHSLFWVHQAHRGGLLVAGNMKRNYFWYSLGRFEQTETGLRLMDTNEAFRGEPQPLTPLFSEDFEGDSLPLTCGLPLIEGEQSLCLSGEHAWSEVYRRALTPQPGMWVRVRLRYYLPDKVWDQWQMRRVGLLLYQGDELVKERWLRLDLFTGGGEVIEQYHDIEVPMDRGVDAVGVQLHNPSGSAHFDDLRVQWFLEE